MKTELTVEGVENYASKLEYIEFEGYELITPWQRKFIASVREQFPKEPTLSKKQMDQIDHIFETVTRNLQ